MLRSKRARLLRGNPSLDAAQREAFLLQDDAHRQCGQLRGLVLLADLGSLNVEHEAVGPSLKVAHATAMP